jgi:TfoX/Sxy family transcriptional regulator of competence genes
MANTFPHLCELVEESTRGLAGVAKRRMFGCDAYFAGDSIFALIWKDGRVGIKLPSAADYDALLATEGAEPWCVGDGKKMSAWVLVPEEMHDDDEALTPWVRKAYQQNHGRTAKASSAKKTTARRAAKKGTAKKVSRAARA